LGALIFLRIVVARRAVVHLFERCKGDAIEREEPGRMRETPAKRREASGDQGLTGPDLHAVGERDREGERSLSSQADG
jgi:hypothetical protein